VKEWWRWLIFGALLLIFFFAFRVQRLDCRIDQGYLEPGLCESLETHFVGRSFFWTDFSKDAVWQEFAEKTEFTQGYQLLSWQKKLPGTLLITLSTQAPEYRLRLGDESFVLAESPKLKNDLSGQQLLEIFYQAASKEEIVEQGYLEASLHQKFISLAQAVARYEIPVERVNWQSQEDLELPLTNGLIVVLDENQDFTLAMRHLAAALKDPGFLEVLPGKKYFDMRFDLPVLKMEK
jgi:hypothetical protein